MAEKKISLWNTLITYFFNNYVVFSDILSEEGILKSEKLIKDSKDG